MLSVIKRHTGISVSACCSTLHHESNRSAFGREGCPSVWPPVNRLSVRLTLLRRSVFPMAFAMSEMSTFQTFHVQMSTDLPIDNREPFVLAQFYLKPMQFVRPSVRASYYQVCGSVRRREHHVSAPGFFAPWTVCTVPYVAAPCVSALYHAESISYRHTLTLIQPKQIY